MDEKAHETLLHHALEFQLALVSNSRISSDDFTKVQREAKELFGDIEGSLRPWLGRTKQDRQTRDVEDFRAMWKEAAGFDLDDVEAREAWEDQVRGLVNDSTVKREAREHEEQEKERKFAATIEAIRQKRLRQQGRK
jgi:cAMP phosphodiesterase